MIKMRLNFVDIGGRFRKPPVGQIVVVKGFSVHYGVPCADCWQYLEGKRINDISIDLELLYNPEVYKPLPD